MTSGKAVLLGAALLCGCGSSFSSGAETTDAASEAGSSADAETEHGPEDSGTDASADVAHDAPELDASPPVDAGHEAACAPVVFPLTMAGCAPITGPGSTWLLQPQATPPACFSYALNEAGVACEQCASTFNCACIDPEGGLIGVTCVNGMSGPVLVQQ